MSLTSQLDDAGSPFAIFMASAFPDVNNALAAFDALRPSDSEALLPRVPDDVHASWRTLNNAIDHRLRYAFSYRGVPSKAVERGIATAWRLSPADSADAVKQTGTGLTAALAALVARERPVQRTESLILPAEAEEALDRMCYAMAWFEQVYLSRRLWPSTPLGDAKPDLTAGQLLDAVPGYAVEDIAAAVKLADSSLAELRENCPPERIHVGPVLDGSVDVGGAAADLIADDLLLEFKSTAKPSALSARDFYQVLGFMILDYSDRYGIRRLGFYLSRFGRIVTWTVEDYLAMLGNPRPAEDLRRECAWRLGA
jgi:hypothetical protein